MSQHPDAEIITGLKAGGLQRRIFEQDLYKAYFYLIGHGAKKHNITVEDAASAYSDAIICVIDHVVNQRFEARSSLKSYIYQIFSNKCVDLLRKETTNKQRVNHGIAIDSLVSELPDLARTAVQGLIIKEERISLMGKLSELGEKCKQVLLFFEDGYSDKEIAGFMEYNSAEVVKTSRLRCLEKLRKMMNIGAKVK